MLLRKFVWCLFVLLLIPCTLQTQCTTPNPPAGLFCDPDVVNGAPLLCELDCLDGYTAMMPPYDDMASQDEQPSPLCETMNGGQPNNMSWFAFIAGSEVIRFRITPFDCSGGQSANGVQAGIYGDCEGIEKLYCESEAQENAFEIGGPGFVMGRVYYFFIDGFEGSQCMYTVEVLEGDQPFPLPDFQFSSDEYTESEILCTGGSITTKVAGLGDEEVSYDYTINPATPTYPEGSHPVTDDSIAVWIFPENGSFEICVTITNGCDVSSNTCMTVTTERLENEIFNDVTICLEDLNSYMGPLSEDPNNDGIIGWQGNTSFLPGINLDTISTSEGCTYIQELNLEVINPGVREQVNLYTCAGNFPVLYEGMSFDDEVSSLSLSLDDRSTLGCDSLIELSISEVLVEGEIAIEQCENSEAVLNFVITNQVPVTYDSVRIFWTDINNEVLTNPDSNVTSISADQSGIYRVTVIFSIDGNHCSFVFDSDFVDFDDLRPSPPAQINWLLEPCADRGEVIYRVSKLEETGVVYQWSYPSDIDFVIDNNADTLTIDWGNSSGGMVCVIVTNSCGTSDPSCSDIVINSMPSAELIIPEESCVGTSVEIFSDGDDSWTYIWDFDGATVVSMESLNGPGPHILEFNLSGSYDVSFSIMDGDCMSDPITADIEILETLPAPEITCLSTDNSIIFNWEDIPGAVDFEATINTSNNGFIDGNSFIVEGLEPGDQVTLDLRALSVIDCANSPIVSAACEAGCEDILFDISSMLTEVCSDRNDPVRIEVSGNIGSSEIMWNPENVVNDSGDFIPSLAEIGENIVVASVELSGCLYSDSLSIIVEELPAWDYELIFPACDGELTALLIVNPSPSSNVYSYSMGGGDIASDTVIVEFGNTMIVATNSTGCSSQEVIDIPFPGNNLFELSGPSTVKKGQSATLVFGYDVRSDFELDSLIIYGTVEGIQCNSNSLIECQSIDILPSISQDYCAEVFYNSDCSDIICHSVQVLEIFEVFAPNVFSPNDDGTNDSFKFVPNNQNIIFNKIRIFDRWGNLVFTIDNISPLDDQSQWDGKISDKAALPGVYLYIIEYLDEENKTIVDQGSVTLIR